jgi:hypothetical protein
MAKRFILFLLAAVVFLLMATVVASAVDRRDGVRDIDRMRYDVLSERAYEGRVGNKGHVVDGLVYFSLKMPEGAMEVQIGPEEFVNASKFRLRVGELVTVLGERVVWRGQNVVLAREVSTMASVFVVRDRDGYPLWDAMRPIRMDAERAESPLCKLEEFR